MTGWSVLIEGRPAKPVDPEKLSEQLADLHAVVSFGDGLLSTAATVDAHSPMEAYDFVYETLAGVVVGQVKIEKAEILSEERQARELEVSNLPDLVGLAEIAELAGTTRQRVFQMTANKGFPAAVLELRSGRLWSRPAIVRYLEGRQFVRARIKTLGSQVGGAGITATLRSKQKAAKHR